MFCSFRNTLRTRIYDSTSIILNVCQTIFPNFRAGEAPSRIMPEGKLILEIERRGGEQNDPKEVFVASVQQTKPRSYDAR